ncbi:MAG TPA: alpha/beta hydrolase [Povalibacter sp.]|nr:alpha/beta hydrolase [Povalibacter sp.]
MSAIIHRQLTVNGISMHVAEQGAGPLILLCHGWPELWYSWRHQLLALAAAGFRAVAPDMRGFGATNAPTDPAAYTILHGVGDMVALVTALGEREAIIVGHDWGAPVAWHSALLRPDVFRAVVGMSVPHRVRPPSAPLTLLRQAGLGDYYWFYFQTPGVAEAEFERDVALTMRKLLYGVSGDVAGERANPLYVRPGAGFLDALTLPEQLPGWLHEEDIELLAGEYRRTGFGSGLNLYRNLDRNWELTAPWHNATINQPALFIAGTRDPVIAGKRGEAAIEQMNQIVPRVRTLMIEGAGHWIQQERPAQVNAALLEFLQQLNA